jgi:NTE family protein
MLIIVVNAKAELKTNVNKLGTGVPLFDTITSSSAISLNEYSFETMTTLRSMLERTDKEVAEGRCAEFENQGRTLTGCDDIQHYLVEVDLDRLVDKKKSKELKQLPTSFALNPEEVDDLRQAARTILRESPEFQRFLDDMN